MNNKNPSHLRLLLVSGAVKSARKRETMRLFQSNAVNCTSEPELSCLQCWWWWWWWRRWLIPRWCDEWVSELVCVCVWRNQGGQWPFSAVQRSPLFLLFLSAFSTLLCLQTSILLLPHRRHLTFLPFWQISARAVQSFSFSFFFSFSFYLFLLPSLPLPEWVSASPKSNRVHLEPFIGPGVFLSVGKIWRRF